MRESKLRDENEWISKNRTHLHKNKMLFGKSIVGTDGRGIEECDPTWLGPDHFYAVDYRSAERLLGGPRARPDQHACRANRAACYLRLERHATASPTAPRRSRATSPPSPTKIAARARAVRPRRLRGGGGGLRDAAALADAASLGQQQLRDDARALTLATADAKAAGDAALQRGDAASAEASYGAALDVEPHFVSALANRAAARLARRRARRRRGLLRGAGPLRGADDGARAAGPVPPAGRQAPRLGPADARAARRGAGGARRAPRGRRRLRRPRPSRRATKLASDLHALKAKADAAEASPPPPPAEADAALD
ncbi:hypothetical protein JL720_13856 [Aureococcus anophagefferens]|nr:hypothetical protein JL720_13856 [Aureococcus anophagefferens]